MRRLPRWVRRVLGIRSPSGEWEEAERRVDWRASLQPSPPLRDERGNPLRVIPARPGVTDDLRTVEHGGRTWAILDTPHGGPFMVDPDALTPRWSPSLGRVHAVGVWPPAPGAVEAGRNLQAALRDMTTTPTTGVAPDATHNETSSGEQMTDDQSDNTTPDRADWMKRHPVAPMPHADRLEVHVRDQWDLDAIHLVPHGDLPGVGRALAFVHQRADSLDVIPMVVWRQAGQEHMQGQEAAPGDPQPGLRLPIALIQPIHEALGKWMGETAPSTVLEGLEATISGLNDDLAEARIEAITNGMQSTTWEVLSTAKDEQIAALKHHLDDMSTIAAEHRARVERLEAPAQMVTGTLESTDLEPVNAERMWTVAQEHTTPERGPEWARIVADVLAADGDGFTTQVGGVKIARCDERGVTDQERHLEATLQRERRDWDRLRIDGQAQVRRLQEHASREVGRAQDAEAEVERLKSGADPIPGDSLEEQMAAMAGRYGIPAIAAWVGRTDWARLHRPGAMSDVLRERGRQIDKGYTPQHDDQHRTADMVRLIHERLPDVGRTYPSADQERDGMVQVAALALAEVEAMDRRNGPPSTPVDQPVENGSPEPETAPDPLTAEWLDDHPEVTEVVDKDGDTWKRYAGPEGDQWHLNGDREGMMRTAAVLVLTPQDSRGNGYGPVTL